MKFAYVLDEVLDTHVPHGARSHALHYMPMNIPYVPDEISPMCLMKFAYVGYVPDEGSPRCLMNIPYLPDEIRLCA